MSKRSGRLSRFLKAEGFQCPVSRVDLTLLAWRIPEDFWSIFSLQVTNEKSRATRLFLAATLKALPAMQNVYTVGITNICGTWLSPWRWEVSIILHLHTKSPELWNAEFRPASNWVEWIRVSLNFCLPACDFTKSLPQITNNNLHPLKNLLFYDQINAKMMFLNTILIV